MKKSHLSIVLAGAVCAASLLVTGCSALRQVAALRHVAFALDRVTDTRLAGVSVERIQRYEELSALDIARIGGALAQQRLPLEFELHVAARNPEENEVDARLLQMSWTLLLEGRRTISGQVDREFILPSGQTTSIPLFIEIDLLDFFDENARDLIELALSVSGEGGTPKNISVEATPTIRTPLGPIRYPQPITIVSRDIG